jgi:dTDP-glucose pyrophosphorylase
MCSVDITLVLPAAGRGSRLLGDVSSTPKGMIPVCGVPLLQYALDVGLEVPISRIVFVISPKGQPIREHFGSSYRNTPVHYAIQAEPMGLAHAVSMAEPYVKEWLLVINGDEIFSNCRHAGMPEFVARNGAEGVVGYLHTPDHRRIQIGYGMTLGPDDRIETLIEKPKTTWNDILGVGTWLHRADFFDYFRRTPIDPARRERDFVSVIQLMVNDGQRIFGFDLEGEFFNVNGPEDLKNAEAALHRRLVASATPS